MSVVKTLLSAEQFDNFPFEEDKRYELDEGELIEMTRPAYNHNRILMNLLFALETYMRGAGIGQVLLSENLYALSPTLRLAPDAAIILGDRTAELRNAKVIHIVPDICAEVLSPSETPARVHRKLRQYFTAGVREVWLIDPEAQTGEVWAGPHLPDHELTAGHPLAFTLLPGFELALETLFA